MQQDVFVAKLQLQSPTNVLAYLAVSVRDLISSFPSLRSMLFIAVKLTLLVYNIVGERRRGLPIIVMPLGVVPRIPRQRIFVPSDPKYQALLSWIDLD